LNELDAELTLYFDKRAQQNFIKSCELYCYQIDRNASSSTWEYAGEIVSDCFPVILSMRLVSRQFEYSLHNIKHT